MLESAFACGVCVDSAIYPYLPLAAWYLPLLWLWLLGTKVRPAAADDERVHGETIVLMLALLLAIAALVFWKFQSLDILPLLCFGLLPACFLLLEPAHKLAALREGKSAPFEFFPRLPPSRLTRKAFAIASTIGMLVLPVLNSGSYIAVIAVLALIWMAHLAGWCLAAWITREFDPPQRRWHAGFSIAALVLAVANPLYARTATGQMQILCFHPLQTAQGAMRELLTMGEDGLSVVLQRAEKERQNARTGRVRVSCHYLLGEFGGTKAASYLGNQMKDLAPRFPKTFSPEWDLWQMTLLAYARAGGESAVDPLYSLFERNADDYHSIGPILTALMATDTQRGVELALDGADKALLGKHCVLFVNIENEDLLQVLLYDCNRDSLPSILPGDYHSCIRLHRERHPPAESMMLRFNGSVEDMEVDAIRRHWRDNAEAIRAAWREEFASHR